jgi:hypothetical protein
MPISVNRRYNYFLRGVPFLLLPAVLIIPALKFLTVCPPEYAKKIAVSFLVVVCASEIWGLTKMFRCFTGKIDFTAIGAIVCSAIGLLVLIFAAWILTLGSA